MSVESERQRSDVLAEGSFSDLGQAFAEGYDAYEVILYPIGRGDRPPQRCPFYAVSNEVAAARCREVYGALRYRLYRLVLLDAYGKTDGGL